MENLAYIKNLQDQILTDDNAIAVCPNCGSEYSANKGDYWDCKPSDAITCCDDIICELVTKHTVFKPIDRLEG